MVDNFSVAIVSVGEAATNVTEKLDENCYLRSCSKTNNIIQFLLNIKSFKVRLDYNEHY